MPSAPAPLRHHTVQVLSRSLLDVVKKLETEGWRQEGGISLDRPFSETQAPNLVQTMARGEDVQPAG